MRYGNILFEEHKMVHDEKKSLSLEDARNTIFSFGTQIQEYLSKIDAKVENYKFSVEKVQDGIAVDISIKATLKGKSE